MSQRDEKRRLLSLDSHLPRYVLTVKYNNGTASLFEPISNRGDHLKLPQPIQRNNTRNNISLMVAFVFSILCFLLAPICALATLILAIQAIEAGKQRDDWKKDKRARLSLYLGILSFTLGILAVIAICLLYVTVNSFEHEDEVGNDTDKITLYHLENNLNV